MPDETSDRARWMLFRRCLRLYGRPYRAQIIAIAVTTALTTVLGLVPVLIIKAFIDDLQRGHPSLTRIGLLFAAGFGVVVAASLVGLVTTWFTLRVRTAVSASVRQQLSTKLLGQSISYFTRQRGGELMSRMLNDITAADAFFDGLLVVTASMAMALGTVLAMFLFEWHLATLTVLLVPIITVLLRPAGRPIYRRRMDVQRSLGTLSQTLQESLSLAGITLIKSFGRESDEQARFTALNDTLRRSQVRSGMTAGWAGVGFSALQFLGPAVLLFFGAWLVIHGYLSLGALVAFGTVLAFRFATSVTGFANGGVAVIGALPAWQRIFELLDAPVEITERPDAVELDPAVGAVRFDGVTVCYEGRAEPALREVDLPVAPGQLVAIVGPSGAGKSTLCSLLPRFYDVQSGAVRIDGHDVRALRLDSLARAISVVWQDTFLFHGTLRENLLYAAPHASPAELASACADAQLDDVVQGLPDGLDTVVGERGHRLSGGEKQRVAIARVILKDSPILILDEATSHLDSRSEQLIQQALARLFEGRTALVIAHRLSTVLAADQIVVLDEGRIVERGTHAELLASGGLYRELFEIQFADPAGASVPSVPDDTDARREALQFIRAARDDAELNSQAQDLDPADGLEAAVALAARAGFAITADALRLAYADDWALRRVRYLSDADGAADAASAESAVTVVNSASSST